MSLFPYRYAAAQEAAKTGMPLMRALPLLYQNDPHARATRDEYLFGPDLLVAPITNENTQRPVYLPEGQWIDYWTGTPAAGGKTILIDAPLDLLPLFVRAGAVLPKIPEDVMTLVPEKESGNKSVKSLDERRVYEVFGTQDSAVETITDFEGRVVTRSGRSLKIIGDPAHVIVRLRFAKVARASVDGKPAKVQMVGDGSVIELDHLKESTVRWE